MDWSGAANNATGSLQRLLQLPEGLIDYQWALYGILLIISCVLLGVYCACVSVLQYVNCFLCPVRTIWWVVSAVVAMVTRSAVFLVRLIIPD